MAQPLPQPMALFSDGLRLSRTVHLPDDLRPGERRVAGTLRSRLDPFFSATPGGGRVLTAAIAVLAAAALLGAALAVPYLRGGNAKAAPWPLAGLHGAIGIGGLCCLVLALRGPRPVLGQGTDSFGIVAATLLALAALAGLGTLLMRRSRRRRGGTLIGLHATLAISGLVVLAAYLFA